MESMDCWVICQHARQNCCYGCLSRHDDKEVRKRDVDTILRADVERRILFKPPHRVKTCVVHGVHQMIEVTR